MESIHKAGPLGERTLQGRMTLNGFLLDPLLERVAVSEWIKQICRYTPNHGRTATPRRVNA